LILGTLVGGILTLMMFSFSMVVVVLNNACASLSPQVIPGLISIEQNSSTRAPSLGVLISVGLGIACLGLLVHFINWISPSIQVEYILNNLYHSAPKKLDAHEDKLSGIDNLMGWPEDRYWQEVCAQRSG
jgi:uncharacterized membrane protein